ncbi:MAG TPA: sugar transferase [Devosiaceae bacterium]
MDIAAASITLMMFSPLLIVVALLIRVTSPGPALFRQPRHGLGGKRFEIFKFRTMYADKGDPTGVEQTMPDDPRITPIGRFIRRSSIDELPQLINVVIGDMSLVGPRPHAIGMRAGEKAYEDVVPYYSLRHAIRPGITGWAQVNGFRGLAHDPEIAQARIAHDMAYIQNMSLLLDLRIILKTIQHEFLSGNAS